MFFAPISLIKKFEKFYRVGKSSRVSGRVFNEVTRIKLKQFFSNQQTDQVLRCRVFNLPSQFEIINYDPKLGCSCSRPSPSRTFKKCRSSALQVASGLL